MKQPNSAALTRFYQTGSSDNFQLFFESSYAWILWKIRQSALNSSGRLNLWAEDIAQDVLLIVFRTRGKNTQWNPGKSLLTTWLDSLVRNACCSHLRRSWVKSHCQSVGFSAFSPKADSDSQLSDGAWVQDFRMTPTEAAIRIEESKAAFQSLLKQFPIEIQELVLLAHFEELTYREIAQITGLSQATISRRLRFFVRRARLIGLDLPLAA